MASFGREFARASRPVVGDIQLTQMLGIQHREIVERRDIIGRYREHPLISVARGRKIFDPLVDAAQAATARERSRLS